MNITISPSIALRQQQLNSEMVVWAKQLVPQTFDRDPLNTPFSFFLPVTDPSLNVVYGGSFPEVVGQLTQLFTVDTVSSR